MGKVLALVLGCSALAFGAQIIPVTVAASSTYPGMDAVALINDSGMAGNLHSSSPSGMWLSNNQNPGSDMPFGMLDFSLLEPALIRSFQIWNYNNAGEFGEGLLRGVSRFEIRFNTGGAMISGGWYDLAMASGGWEGPQTFVLPQDILAGGITLILVGNHGDQDYLGLSEVRFFSSNLGSNNSPTFDEGDTNPPPSDGPVDNTGDPTFEDPAIEDPGTPNADAPEPASIVLFGTGLAAILYRRYSQN
jgi:hypothetical protein